MKPKLDIWTVYERPTDYPEGFVVRLHVVCDGQSNPTDTVFFGSTIESVREHIPKGLYRMDRCPLDEPQIVEVWL